MSALFPRPTLVVGFRVSGILLVESKNFTYPMKPIIAATDWDFSLSYPDPPYSIQIVDTGVP